MSDQTPLRGTGPSEKGEEKEHEKREEKSPQEKSWDEKYRRDPLGSTIWAAILIWAGVALLGDNLGLVPASIPLAGWALVFAGAGLILLLEVLIRLTVPSYRRPVAGTIILAIIFIGIGLQDIVSWNLLWPIALVLIGLAILVRNVGRRG